LNKRSTINRLFPPRCVLCGNTADGNTLCPPCLNDLPWLSETRCPQCALPTPDGQICGSCLNHPPAFDRTFAPLTYDFPAGKLIQALKYNHRLEITSVLAEIWLGRSTPNPLPDLLVPMPLHPARLRERGFNQAYELGRALVRPLKLVLAHDACQRIRDTPPQATLPLKARQKNLRGAFSASMEKISGKRVAIVDDVMTSGSSLNELAAILKKAGAVEVECWVMARALPSIN
jgi:ComF family protein